MIIIRIINPTIKLKEIPKPKNASLALLLRGILGEGDGVGVDFIEGSDGVGVFFSESVFTCPP